MYFDATTELRVTSSKILLEVTFVLTVVSLFLSSSKIAAHESSGLDFGANASSIKHPLLSPAPLDTKKFDELDADESSRLDVIFENLGNSLWLDIYG